MIKYNMNTIKIDKDFAGLTSVKEGDGGNSSFGSGAKANASSEALQRQILESCNLYEG